MELRKTVQNRFDAAGDKLSRLQNNSNNKFTAFRDSSIAEASPHHQTPSETRNEINRIRMAFLNMAESVTQAVDGGAPNSGLPAHLRVNETAL